MAGKEKYLIFHHKAIFDWIFECLEKGEEARPQVFSLLWKMLYLFSEKEKFIHSIDNITTIPEASPLLTTYLSTLSPPPITPFLTTLSPSTYLFAVLPSFLHIISLSAGEKERNEFGRIVVELVEKVA